jgi:16S rRNA (cytidine1402-2'-O)-methyltransferase
MLELVPVPLHEEADPLECMPASAIAALREARLVIAERERSAWRLLSKLRDKASLSEIQIRVFDEHSPPGAAHELAIEIKAFDRACLVSEAGCPCVADPGSAVVAAARAIGVAIRAHPGPSSIMEALMLSGLGGQRFEFRGYLPVKQHERIASIRAIEAASLREGSTQVFIEAPYRNDVLFADLCRTLKSATRLFIAIGLASREARFIHGSVSEIVAQRHAIGKIPAIFLVSA